MTRETHRDAYLLLRTGERELFLGRALEGPPGATVLVGKPFARSGDGFVTEPFATRLEVPAAFPSLPRAIEGEAARAEAHRLLASEATAIRAAASPLLFRALQAALPAPGGEEPARHAPRPTEEFDDTAGRFRRTLLAAPGVTTTLELDRLAELEGDLVIELGRVTNDVAVRFNALLGRHPGLASHLRALGVAGESRGAGADGWTFLATRLRTAATWARSHGETPLVREINKLRKEAVGRADEVLLDHVAALDTLIAETLSTLDVAPEPWREVEPAVPPAPASVSSEPPVTTAGVVASSGG